MTAVDVAISPCVGCGEHAEPIDPADLGLGLVIDHRGGCLAAPERPAHTCLYLDGDVVEATGAHCGPCLSAGDVEKTARLSDDGAYRYELTRTWDPSRPAVAWIMLNPSTADADVDDPTIRRCMSFARTWGYGGIVVANIFAVRATDPGEITSFVDPVGGRENDRAIWQAASTRDVVCAWGASVPHYWRHRPPAVVERLRGRGVPLCHLGLTKAGHPRHPLYVKGDTPLTRWETA